VELNYSLESHVNENSLKEFHFSIFHDLVPNQQIPNHNFDFLDVSRKLFIFVVVCVVLLCVFTF
jgi:hypothetical protein